MREISAVEITRAVAEMCIEANCVLNKDVYCAMERACAAEKGGTARDILGLLLENAQIAAADMSPICQDTGMAVVFAQIGQEVHITGGGLADAINEGVRRGYRDGYLRKSVVGDPIIRKNTGDNTPAVIHYDIAPGDGLKLIVAPKGFGSENMSRIYMLKPSQGVEGVKKAVYDTVREAGSNPCPPVVVGVGLGGTFEKAALLAKRALLRPLDIHSEDPETAALERELLDGINALGIGAAGFGGTTTALGVAVETFPTHIAGLPVAVNISCHVTRHAEREL